MRAARISPFARPETLLVFVVIPLLVLLQLVQAQGFFQQFFNAGQGEAREEEAPTSGDSAWWNARVEAGEHTFHFGRGPASRVGTQTDKVSCRVATCTKYLCPRTLSCVDKPAECPCPFPEQIRCPYSDSESGSIDLGGSNCIQEKDCNRVQLMRALGHSFRLKDLQLR